MHWLLTELTGRDHWLLTMKEDSCLISSATSKVPELHPLFFSIECVTQAQEPLPANAASAILEIQPFSWRPPLKLKLGLKRSSMAIRCL